MPQNSQRQTTFRFTYSDRRSTVWKINRVILSYIRPSVRICKDANGSIDRSLNFQTVFGISQRFESFVRCSYAESLWILWHIFLRILQMDVRCDSSFLGDNDEKSTKLPCMDRICMSSLSLSLSLLLSTGHDVAINVITWTDSVVYASNQPTTLAINLYASVCDSPALVGGFPLVWGLVSIDSVRISKETEVERHNRWWRRKRRPCSISL